LFVWFCRSGDALVSNRAVLFVFVMLFALGSVLAVAVDYLGSRLHSRAFADQDVAGAHEGPLRFQRIICIAPSATELVFALGRTDQVVGVSDFCADPPEAVRKRKIGGYINPNFETILDLSPDLVIIQGKHEAMTRFCRQWGIELFRVEMKDFATISDDIRALGRLLQCAPRAEKLAAYLDLELAEVRAAVAGLPRRKVFLCLNRTPDSLAGLFTTGGGTYLDELIRVAGGVNVFDDLSKNYTEISKEGLLLRAPEIIIETRWDEEPTPERRAQLIDDWQSMPDLPAVAGGRVYVLTDSSLQVPGPRMGRAARLFAQVIHPESPRGQ